MYLILFLSIKIYKQEIVDKPYRLILFATEKKNDVLILLFFAVHKCRISFFFHFCGAWDGVNKYYPKHLHKL